MGINNNINNALNSALANVSGIPIIYYPNVDKEPKQNVDYVRPTLLPAKVDVYTLNDEHLWSGIYQVDIYTQLKKGTSQIQLIADTISDYFDNKAINTNGIIVYTEVATVSSARVNETRWWCHVDVPYWCPFKP